MNSGINIKKIWENPDLVELCISVSDGKSQFTNQVYVGNSAFAKAIEDLERFKSYTNGEMVDIQLGGGFGPEWANGAFHARFNLLPPGRLYLIEKQGTEFMNFAKKDVANTATLHIKSEQGMLDTFISDLSGIASGACDEAFLSGVSHL